MNASVSRLGELEDVIETLDSADGPIELSRSRSQVFRVLDVPLEAKRHALVEPRIEGGDLNDVLPATLVPRRMLCTPLNETTVLPNASLNIVRKSIISIVTRSISDGA